MSLDYTADDVVRYRDNVMEGINEAKESIEAGAEYVATLRSEVSELTDLIGFLPNAPVYEVADRTRVINDRLIALTNGNLETVIHQVTRFGRHINLIEGAMPCEDGIRTALYEHQTCHSDEDFDEAKDEVPEDHYCECPGDCCDDEHFDSDYHINRDDVLVSTDSTGSEDLEKGYVEADSLASILRAIASGTSMRDDLELLASRLEDRETIGVIYETGMWPTNREPDDGVRVEPRFPVVQAPCSREHVTDDWIRRDSAIVTAYTSRDEDFHRGWMPVSIVSQILERIRQGDYQRENLAQLTYEMSQYHMPTQPVIEAEDWPKIKGLVQ